MLVGLLLTGVFATNIVGQWWLRQGTGCCSKIPIVKSIYSSVKQVSDTLFSSSGNAFREAVLVQYPRAGLLDDRLRHRQARRRGGAAPARRLPQRLRADDAEPDLGLLPDAAARDVIALAMSVDEALKYVISMGVVAPPTRIDPARSRCEICRAERPARAQPAAATAQPKRQTHAPPARRPRPRQECME